MQVASLAKHGMRVAQWAIRSEWPVRMLKPVMGRFNPFLPDFRRDPYAQYAALRRDAPVYFSPMLRGWILSRHRDVAAVLHDPRFSVDRSQSDLFRRFQPFAGQPADFATAIQRNLLMLDPPDHTRLRRLVNKAFTPRMVERLRARVQALVAEILSQHRRGGEMDLIRDFAHPLPVTVIAEMLGVPASDRERFKAWSENLVALLDPLQSTDGLAGAQQAYFEFSEYTRRIFAERRREPRDDLISALVAVEEQGETLSEPEVLSLCMLILGAGHETTTNLIGNAVVALLRFPEQKRRLLDEPALMPTAVEEFLRFDSPVQTTDRVATEDGDLFGQPVRKGQLVGLIIGAANRDPEQFAEPERLDVGRQENDHLAFSRGVHFCLGASLARLEAEVAIGALLERFPDFRADLEQLEWKRSLVLRGITRLRLLL